MAILRRRILFFVSSILSTVGMLCFSNNGTLAAWPIADVFVGNPPFLGDRVMVASIEAYYTARLRAAYAGKVPGGATLVCYWCQRAQEALQGGESQRVGFVATNSIRNGANRHVLDTICSRSIIYEARSDEPWTLDGAFVRVSLVCFACNSEGPASLDGAKVAIIHPDLTAGSTNLTATERLLQNRGAASGGIQKTGAFEMTGVEARRMLAVPSNPNGQSNSDVVRPWWNGLDVARRNRDMWIVDFGLEEDESNTKACEG